MAADHLTRRLFFPTAALAGAAACSQSDAPKAYEGPKSPVFIAKAASYSVEIAALIESGIRACGLAVKGKNVLLKPNLVEFDASTAINTNVAVLAAAFEVFQKLGAASVTIGEGPGHRRDTPFLAHQARYPEIVRGFEDHFVDLNRDDVAPVANFVQLPEIYLPKTALAADVIVSVAKMKTHHWVGATLSMKNFFGVVPGAVYGWPKNVLHQQGISESIVGLNRIFRKTFAIIDGIVGMEGNGPIQGTPKPAGVLVMGQDLVAVDCTCCRIMGIDPLKLTYMRQALDLGNTAETGMEQRGEAIGAVRTSFSLIEEFAYARLGSS